MKMQKYMTLQSFKKKYGTESACLKALLEFRMSPDRLCFNEKCQAPIDKFYHPLKGKKAFICARCLKHIYPMVNSSFDHSHVSLADWFVILYQMLYSRNGVSANEIHRVYGYSYPTAYRMVNTIRELMQVGLDFDLENSVVEIDESYIMTGTKGFGRHHKFHSGRGSQRSTSILAICERKGVVKLCVIPTTDADTILPIILEQVPKTTIISTDNWGAYHKLEELGYKHITVNHSAKTNRYVDGSASTNTAEGIFSGLKRTIRGTYRNVSDGKLNGYLTEHSYRYSFRFEEDYGFETLMKCLPPLSETYGTKNIAA